MEVTGRKNWAAPCHKSSEKEMPFCHEFIMLSFSGDGNGRNFTLCCDTNLTQNWAAGPRIGPIWPGECLAQKTRLVKWGFGKQNLKCQRMKTIHINFHNWFYFEKKTLVDA